MKATKKQITVRFIRWKGNNLVDVIKFTGLHESARHLSWSEYSSLVNGGGLKIFTNSGSYITPVGHAIIKSEDGLVWPCEYSVFNKTYITKKNGVAVRRPVEIDFVRLTTSNIREVYSFIHGEPNIKSSIAFEKWCDYEDIVRSNGITVNTIEGNAKAMIGDVVIKGVDGEFYPSKYDSFKELYDFN